MNLFTIASVAFLLAVTSVNAPAQSRALQPGVGGTSFSCETTESDGVLCSCEGVQDCTIMAKSGVCDAGEGKKDDTGCAPALGICNCTLGGARVSPGPELRPQAVTPATHNAPKVRDHRSRARAPTASPAAKAVRRDETSLPKD